MFAGRILERVFPSGGTGSVRRLALAGLAAAALLSGCGPSHHAEYNQSYNDGVQSYQLHVEKGKVEEVYRGPYLSYRYNRTEDRDGGLWEGSPRKVEESYTGSNGWCRYTLIIKENEAREAYHDSYGQNAERSVSWRGNPYAALTFRSAQPCHLNFVGTPVAVN